MGHGKTVETGIGLDVVFRDLLQDLFAFAAVGAVGRANTGDAAGDPVRGERFVVDPVRPEEEPVIRIDQAGAGRRRKSLTCKLSGSDRGGPLCVWRA